MFSFLIRLKRRIRKLLKVESVTRQRPPTTFRSKSFKFFVLVVFSLVVGILYSGQSLFDPLDVPRKGEISLDDVIAPFQITVFKTDRELRDEMEDMQAAIPFVLDYDTLIVANAYRGLTRFFYLVDSLAQSPGWAELKNSGAYRQIMAARFPLLSEAALLQSFELTDRQRVQENIRRILDEEIYRTGVVPDLNALPDSRNKNVMIRRDGNQSIHPRSRIYSVVTAQSRYLTALNAFNATDSIDVDYHYLVGRSFIQPNLRINMSEYDHRVEEAVASVSNIKEVVEAGDIVVRAGRKVTEEQQRVLQEMSRLLRSQAAEKGWWPTYLPMISKLLLVIACFVLLYLFLYFFRKDIYYSNQRLIAIYFIYGLQLLLVYLISFVWEQSQFLYPVALLPIMITLLFDAELGVLATVVMALLLGIMHRFDYSLALMTMLIGMVACFASRRVRKRTDFFRIMYVVALSFALYFFLVERLKLSPTDDVFTEVGFGVLNGVLTAILVIGLLPFFESMFGITTDVALLELSDMNHPLLKRLALEAPGTYHHSIIVGNLTEAAAKAIGGNALLARVGAYFHDIGKIEIPEYFVENQLGIKSKHEELTPSMSSIILSSHVKKGRFLGEMSDIPDDVLNFIEEHHGTMVQTYFYNKALQRGEDPSVVDKYRYPGPKPQTRETGIAMLADAVEAASRTLDDPKPARLNSLIQRIINDRFQSGELDECPLTLRDLAKIKEAFTQILVGIFHHRVVYPRKGKTDDE